MEMQTVQSLLSFSRVFSVTKQREMNHFHEVLLVLIVRAVTRVFVES